MQIPAKGLARETIMDTLRSYKEKDLDWQSGQVMGYVYDAGEKAMEVIKEAYTMYLSENALDPTTYPSLLRIENEVVRMIANLLRGDGNVVGNFTSGGTESLILAVKTARDLMRFKKPQIKEPEMVLPITAHSSFYKAAHYLCVKPVIVPVLDGSYKADVAASRGTVADYRKALEHLALAGMLNPDESQVALIERKTAVAEAAIAALEAKAAEAEKAAAAAAESEAQSEEASPAEPAADTNAT